MKISIIGAGNVGSATAMRIAESGLADVVLLDVLGGRAEGKSLDISDAQTILSKTSSQIKGTEDYTKIEDSSIVVVTAGLPRKPGMSRQDLLVKNTRIIKELVLKIKRICPEAIVIMVTNPLDAMTYLAYKVSGFKPNRVMGMAGDLDGARFSNLIAGELNVPRVKIKAMVIGEHGDSMLPLARWTKVSGKPLVKILSKEKIQSLIDDARKRGARIVSLLNTSAYFGPSAAIFRLVEAILKDKKEIFCVSAYLDGEYGLDEVCIGVPARIGRNGIEEIVQLNLDREEKIVFNQSAEIVRETIKNIRQAYG